MGDWLYQKMKSLKCGTERETQEQNNSEVPE